MLVFLTTIFLLPFFPFIDEKSRYDVYFVIINLLLATYICRKAAKGLAFNQIFRQWGFVLIVLSSVFCISNIYGYFSIVFKPSIADFSDVYFSAFVFQCTLAGYMLRREKSTEFDKTYGTAIHICLYTNAFIIVLQWLFPVIGRNPISEFVVSLYDPTGQITVDYWRPTGTIGQAGQLGLALTFLFVYYLVTLFSRPTKLGIFNCILIFVLAVLSGGKTSVISIVFIFVVYLCYHSFSKFSKLNSVNLFGATLITVPLIYIMISFSNTNSDLQDSGDIKFWLFRESNSLSHRQALRAAALDEISDSPIIGFGAAKDYYEDKQIFDHGERLYLRHPDSSITLYMLRYGALGLVTWFAMMLFIFYSGHRLNKLSNGNSIHGQTVCFVSLAFLFASYSDPIFNTANYSTWFFVLFGSALYETDKLNNNCDSTV